jgi:hypothetical protein
VHDLNLETIVAQLDAPYTGKLPKRTLRAAQRRGAEMVPLLIDLLKKATAAIQAGETPNTNGHLFALYLLNELRAKEALPVIVEAVSLPGEGPFDLCPIGARRLRRPRRDDSAVWTNDQSPFSSFTYANFGPRGPTCGHRTASPDARALRKSFLRAHSRAPLHWLPPYRCRAFPVAVT